jgi:hypothetical protein
MQLPILLWILLIFQVAAQILETISITKDASYRVLPECAQICVAWIQNSVNSCEAPWYNACLCDVNMASRATQFVSSCITSRCSVGAGAQTTIAQTANAAYATYCDKAGYSLPIAAASVPPIPPPTATSSSGGEPAFHSARAFLLYRAAMACCPCTSLLS